ncbi:TPA: hypothetical protein U2Q93_001563 [Enterobacter sichuanensis]|nr:hypothetical protein [Enterobacter sichuanensis]HEM8743910.1 hypothetical protein [Enterobacter sichuanensis]
MLICRPASGFRKLRIFHFLLFHIQHNENGLDNPHASRKGDQKGKENALKQF